MIYVFYGMRGANFFGKTAERRKMLLWLFAFVGALSGGVWGWLRGKKGKDIAHFSAVMALIFLLMGALIMVFFLRQTF